MTYPCMKVNEIKNWISMHKSKQNQKLEIVRRKSVILKIKFIGGRAQFFLYFFMKLTALLQ